MAIPRNDFEYRGMLKPGYYSFRIGAPCADDLKTVLGYLEVCLSCRFCSSIYIMGVLLYHIVLYYIIFLHSMASLFFFSILIIERF